MKTGTLDKIYGAIFMAAAGFLYLVSFEYRVAGRAISQNPVWYPRILLVLMMGAAIILFIRGMVKSSADSIPAIDSRVLSGAMIATGIYLILFQNIGFIWATLLLIPSMSCFLGARRPWVIVSVTVGFTLLVWYGFNDLLNVQPPGIALPSLRSMF
ncbi:tripartite tricarboxylate transporter TctB family protein [Desulforhopalus singaporensis]|uniref:Putative tricarboxylic transport membrane protein n=1 Tax=Desulforhopalus singaporensis TaxID=91360 RepID=A0A1H0V1U2_9BACT|nr:tripartite tricarboxylate transporter TctB family protein [Desulforhopalus singaporensis]SDP72314.1 putative tricarboxylic transport membrane protein [Desulforhopalus singaporensis]